eukprot:3536910-Pyramimonas_sp.AAC.1
MRSWSAFVNRISVQRARIGVTRQELVLAIEAVATACRCAGEYLRITLRLVQLTFLPSAKQ